jgi:HD-GYP domain-containing protein (c-di-GMP phosphodiesterase class II)
MQEIFELVLQKRKLSYSEYELVRSYIKIGIYILQQIPEMPSYVVDVSLQHHERMSSSGYLGLQEKEIHDYAKIIGVVDSFESLTHTRPHHEARDTKSALRELLETASSEFARKAIKILIKQIGIYPTGTFVMLNTQEVAEVIKNNENHPLRPVVKVVYTFEDKLKSLKIIDLLSNQNVYISTTLKREEALKRAIPTESYGSTL